MDEFENLMRQVQDSARYKTYSDVTPGYLRRLIALEKAAITILAYETHVVPGLLQTPSYARAVIRTAMPEGDEAEIDRHVRARIDRQSLFHSDHRPEVLALLDEGVLRRPVGGPEVMCEQITFLRTAMATEARVNILIVPFDRAAIAPNYPITHLHFGDGGPSELVYVEQMNKADYWTRPAYLDQYRLVITKLMDVALSREETIDFLNDMHGQYEAQMRRG
ncbi:DUF5753 domain-containing protein [Streptomyces sp. AK02-01A]|uniref:DUF5753 domain-containing protein n=1 Tax=Streptomyces sp. AK02-01A TaxID=3028648 RepID=UPI0029A727B0|nr:DUF5753 domain-containing protein [Streptomyces sp. AK02-01A]MDX3855925.1 DUF5753 domain-containing protein [Streptomyces sp. AK02-01A]